MPLLPVERGCEANQQLEREKKLPARIVGSNYCNDPAVTDPVAIVQRLRARFHSDLVRARALKINLDGGESQHTAVFIKPTWIGRASTGTSCSSPGWSAPRS